MPGISDFVLKPCLRTRQVPELVSEPSLTENEYDSDGELADLPPLRRARLSQPQAPPSPTSAIAVSMLCLLCSLCSRVPGFVGHGDHASWAAERLCICDHWLM